ncbi:MAG: AAA family ATPase, partial [Flaviflexus sp.]|nr:AAA family ATPase [Flaviflexus sp.]
MHLKQLTLRGFKSFATATQLTFEPGINCVVGPNGSGKSNVVDALAWVMGEQGAKTLRGGSMADVIFAGTSSRPALGRAEVSLTIDNSDGALPISYSEVTISRTLFRSGGSEYALNGTPVRLLDIQELLSDTGMGREMHVIIGQGRLDDVLTASPEERRYFIEEAAGVLKHRRRKDKALRKLDAMQANLQRLTDLTAELRRQLGPLARQAKAARTAQVIQAEVRDARARLLADDLAQAQARLASLSADDEKLEERRSALAAQREACREEVAAAEAEAARAHPLLADLTETWQRLSTQAERFTSLASLAAERRRSLEREETPERRESPEQLRERARKAREDELALTEARDRAHLALEQAEEKRAQREEAEREADREAAALARTLADNREDAARLAGRITTAQSQIASLTEESERVEAAKAGALERAAAAQAQVADAEAQVVAHDGGDDELSKDHERRSEALQGAKAALEAALAAENEARTRRDVATTRAATLTASLEPADASAEIASEIPGITGWLRERLEVASGWEAAAEAALGELAGALLAEGIDPAIDALRHARDTEAGRVILALADASDELPGKQAEALNEAARTACEKAEAERAALAAEAVTGSWPGLAALLAGTVFAADLAEARRIHRAGAPRVITAAGDVLTAQTARGGARNEASILARQAEARAAEAEAEQAATDLQRAAEAVSRARESLDEAQGTYDAASAELHARDAQLAAATAQLGVLRQSLTAANDEIARNSQRLEKIAERLAAAREELAGLTAEREARQVDPAELEERLAAAQAEKAARHEATTAARSAETEARLAAKVAEERARVIEGKPEALERQARAEEARLVE